MMNRLLLAALPVLLLVLACACSQAQGADQPAVPAAAGETKALPEGGDGVPVGPLVKPGTLQPMANGKTPANGKAGPGAEAFGNGAAGETKAASESPQKTNGKATTTPPTPPPAEARAKGSKGPSMAKTGLDLTTLYVTCALLVALGAVLVVLARVGRVRRSA